jgi:hypothetical protein
MKKKIYIIVFLLTAIFFCSSGILKAQTFEEYKKQREQEMQQFKEEREKQMQQLAAEFDKYVEERDKEFTDYLKKRWTQFQVFRGLEIPAEPKPDVAPAYTEPDRPKPPEALPTIIPEIKIKPEDIPKPILPRVTKKEPPKFPVHTSDFDFYGFPVLFDYDKKVQVKPLGDVNEESIGNYFAEMSNTNYNQLISQLNDYRQLMNLNDWGYYQLVQKAAAMINRQDEKTTDLLTWFILLRSGYKVKIAYFENDVYLLLPILNQVYGKNFFQLDNLNYYLMDGELLELYTYETDFQDAQKVFDLNIYKPISLGEEPAEKTFSFNYQGAEAPISIIYNSSIIEFYREYPLSDIKVYFDAVVSPAAKESLAENFIPLLQGKSELEAVNMLLNFVQTAFEYKTDQDQFGYEKYFFAEEAFYYPFCDCEDRSVLFAYLVKSLLGLEVIGLNYPGHIATAVKFNESVGGDYVSYNGENYVVSDPTYINAPVGLTMPQYAGEVAELVEINNNYKLRNTEEKIWQTIIAAGGNRASNSGDIVLDEQGNALLTGYFTKSFSFSNINETANGNPSVFALKMDTEMDPAWFVSAEVDGAAFGYTIVPDKNGNTYVAGTFRGDMKMKGRQLNTGGVSDVFVAKLDNEGQLLWLEKANIDTVNQENFLNFVSRFDAQGYHLGNDLYFETGDYKNYGLHLAADGGVYFAGAFNKSTGMNIAEMSLDELGEYDIVEAIKAENDRLISENCDKTIAGLYAVLSVVKSSGVTIPGADAQRVLDKYNPKFKDKFSGFYESIGRINFLKNQDGIVTIKTDNGKDVYFDMLRVQNDSKARIIFLEDGNAQLELLSGAKVGKAFIWFPLNYVVMYKHNGDMLFDFANDHSQKVMNLREDILD